MGAELYDSLDGQVALVTGANRGIGEAIAAKLEALGATVYAGARDCDDVDAPDQRPVELDVTERDQISAAIDRIEEEAGRLDVLVNNAGVNGERTTLGERDPSEIESVLDVNLHGPMQLCRAALPLLTEREGGRVVNVTSGAGQFVGGDYSNPDRIPYCASKAGLNMLTKMLVEQYPDLLVNAVIPGWVRTGMGGPDAPRSPEEGAEYPVWLARFKPGSPSGKLWRDDEIEEW